MVPALLILFAAAVAVVSRGFLEADELTHFLVARSVWTDWSTHLLSIWGRMGVTGFYAVPALMGVVACRLAAVGVTAVTAMGTAALLRLFLPSMPRGGWIRRHATAFAWLLLFAQPCFALNSFTVMTEMLLAATWVWAAVVLLKYGRSGSGGMIAAGFILGLGGLMRPEGWIAIAVCPLALVAWIVLTRGPGALRAPRIWGVWAAAVFMACLPSLAWYGLGVAAYGDGIWFIHKWPWAARSPYGSRTAQFFGGALLAMAVWMWIPMLLAMVRLAWPRSARRAARAGLSPNEARGDLRKAGLLLLAAPLLGFFFVHGVLGSFGLFGSMALPRYFICVAPMAAVLGVCGLMQLEARIAGIRRVALRRIALRGFAGAAIAAPLFTLAGLVYLGLLPTWPSQSICSMDVIDRAAQARFTPDQYRTHLILAHPYSIMQLGLPLGTPADSRVFDPAALEHAEPGTLLLMEQQLWLNEGRPTFAQLALWGWEEDARVNALADAARPPIIFPLAYTAKGQARLWVKTR